VAAAFSCSIVFWSLEVSNSASSRILFVVSSAAARLAISAAAFSRIFTDTVSAAAIWSLRASASAVARRTDSIVSSVSSRDFRDQVRKDGALSLVVRIEPFPDAGIKSSKLLTLVALISEAHCEMASLL
jgi:hypothetical protein